MQTCAFTGHRKIEDSHKSRIDGLLDRAIAFAYESGCRTFVTGGALGFDTLAAKEIIRFRMSHPDVKLIIVLPCKTQSSTWSASQVSLYEYTLFNADEIEYISDEYTDTCMKERNKRLVELCDMLIAYVSRPYSGAAQTVRMASNDGKVIYNLYPSLEKT
jgi:uncharacterized phage-like protein YoqJ